MSKFKIAKSNLGYVKLSDGAIIYLRIVVIDIKEGKQKPVGPDLGVVHTVLLKVEPPPSFRDEVKEKPLPPPDDSHLENLAIWEPVNIIEAETTCEECSYDAKDNHVNPLPNPTPNRDF